MSAGRGHTLPACMPVCLRPQSFARGAHTSQTRPAPQGVDVHTHGSLCPEHVQLCPGHQPTQDPPQAQSPHMAKLEGHSPSTTGGQSWGHRVTFCLLRHCQPRPPHQPGSRGPRHRAPPHTYTTPTPHCGGSQCRGSCTRERPAEPWQDDGSGQGTPPHQDSRTPTSKDPVPIPAPGTGRAGPQEGGPAPEPRHHRLQAAQCLRASVQAPGAAVATADPPPL